MRVTGVSGAVEGARGDGRPPGDVLWLAVRDVRRTWVAYLTSALYVGMLGAFIALPGAMGPGTYSFEIIMFAVGMILTTPFFAREYMSWATDPIAERLAWLRVLPIGVPTIVRSRALAILAALPLNPVAFFMPLWFGGRWEMGRGEFLWFAVSMTGISLIGAGFTLVMEMSVGIRRWIIVNIVTMVSVFVAIFAIGLGLDIRLFEKLTRAVAWNGPLTALICVAGGAGVFAWCMRLAEDGLRRRELVP